MSTIAWYFGRGLQVLGLITVGFSLFIGLRTGDSKQEITLLGIGAVEFLVGLLCLKGSNRQ